MIRTPSTLLRRLATLCSSFVLVAHSTLLSQDSASVNGTSHSVTFNTEFIQIKEGLNYGLVYNGINLAAGYIFEKTGERYRVFFTPQLAFGATFNKGTGFAWRFKPIDLFYGRTLKCKRLTIGAYVATDYQWQQYSELHGGRLFWFSSIEIGPQVAYRYVFKSLRINALLANSIAGFTSRPPAETETYYYEFSFSEFVSVANQDLQFGSYDLFNRTKFKLELQPATWTRLSLSYSYEYFAYYDDPTLKYSNHSISAKWKFISK